MSAKSFAAATAHDTPEFKAFLQAVKELVGSKGQGINSALVNATEVSCKYKDFAVKFALSADVKKCVSVLRQRRAHRLESFGLTWGGGTSDPRLSVKLEQYAQPEQVNASAARGAQRGKKREGTYKAPKYARSKFRSSDVGKCLDTIEDAFRTKVELGEWTKVEHKTYMEQFLLRVDGFRTDTGPKHDSISDSVIQNLRKFLSDVRANKRGTHRHDLQRAANTVMAVMLWLITHSSPSPHFVGELMLNSQNSYDQCVTNNVWHEINLAKVANWVGMQRTPRETERGKCKNSGTIK